MDPSRVDELPENKLVNDLQYIGATLEEIKNRQRTTFNENAQLYEISSDQPYDISKVVTHQVNNYGSNTVNINFIPDNQEVPIVRAYCKIWIGATFATATLWDPTVSRAQLSHAGRQQIYSDFLRQDGTDLTQDITPDIVDQVIRIPYGLNGAYDAATFTTWVKVYLLASDTGSFTVS